MLFFLCVSGGGSEPLLCKAKPLYQPCEESSGELEPCGELNHAPPLAGWLQRAEYTNRSCCSISGSFETILQRDQYMKKNRRSQQRQRWHHQQQTQKRKVGAKGNRVRTKCFSAANLLERHQHRCRRPWRPKLSAEEEVKGRVAAKQTLIRFVSPRRCHCCQKGTKRY